MNDRDHIDTDDRDVGGVGNSDFTDDVNNNGYYIDESVSESDAAIISSVMETLPEEMQQQTVKIVVDPALLQYCSPSSANGCFLRKGACYQLYDGSIYKPTDDTIVLASADAAENALWEESLHQWQFHNCCLDNKISGHLVDMEKQADAVEAIIGRLNRLKWTSISGDAADDDQIRDLVVALLSTNDIDTFVQAISSNLKLFTDSTTWDNKWDDLLPMFVPKNHNITISGTKY